MKKALASIGRALGKVAYWSSQRKKFLVAEVPVLVALYAAAQENGIDQAEWGVIIGLQLAALGVHQVTNQPPAPGEEGEEA